MRIAYIMDSFANTGGLERIFTDKMNYLAEKQGYEVYFITALQGTNPMRYKLSSKITHIDLGVRWYDVYRYKQPLRYFKTFGVMHTMRSALQNSVDKIDLDILICPTKFYPEMVCKIKGPKIIIESHGAKSCLFALKEECRNSLYRTIKNIGTRRNLNYVEKHCDYLVALTKGDYDEWHIKESRKRIIPNFINQEHSFQSDCTAKRVIAAGRLASEKRFGLLVDAWAKVARSHSDWHLDIYGMGELEESLNWQIESLGLAQSAAVHSYSEQIHKEYAKSSIFALSSQYEGFGLVLAEAMSCGVPCVSFDCPYGPSDIIKDKEDGLLVENGNVEALADAICWMIEHDDERKEMGCKAKEDVRRFAPNVIMPQWDRLFHELVNKKDK